MDLEEISGLATNKLQRNSQCYNLVGVKIAQGCYEFYQISDKGCLK